MELKKLQKQIFNNINIIRIVCQTIPNENKIYDMLGNVSELCYDEEKEEYVFMGGNMYSSREEIQSLKAIPYDNYKTYSGAAGFRVVWE